MKIITNLLLIFFISSLGATISADDSRKINRLVADDPSLYTQSALFTPPQKRLALVIGNAEYGSNLDPLPNAENDAQAMSKKLSALGFDVTLATDVNQKLLQQHIERFMARLADSNAETVGLFYYAGHGVEVAGENYLLPVGDVIKNKQQLIQRAVPLSRVLRGFAQAGNHNGSNFLILDACRDNPLGSGWSKPNNHYSVKNLSWFFGTGYGKKASENSQQGNGLFTQHLLTHLGKQGLTSDQVFKRVTGAVAHESGDDQIPEVGGSPTNEFMFYPGKKRALALIIYDTPLWLIISLILLALMLVSLAYFYYRYQRKTAWTQGIDLTRDLHIDKAVAAPIIKRSRLASDEITGYLKSLSDKKIVAIIPSSYPLTLGRNDNTNVVLERDEISGEHAKIGWDKENKQFWITDLDSTNGTWWGENQRLNANEQYALASGQLFYLSDQHSPYVVIAHKQASE